jgi:hypothetical protein
MLILFKSVQELLIVVQIGLNKVAGTNKKEISQHLWGQEKEVKEKSKHKKVEKIEQK